MVGLMTPPAATISEQSQLRPTQKMTGMQIRHCHWGLRQRPMIQGRMAASGSGRIVARSGHTHLHLQDIGGQESDTRGITRVQLATLQKLARVWGVTGANGQFYSVSSKKHGGAKTNSGSKRQIYLMFVSWNHCRMTGAWTASTASVSLVGLHDCHCFSQPFCLPRPTRWYLYSETPFEIIFPHSSIS